MNLDIFNPWWRTREVPRELVGWRRHCFKEVKKYLDERQIILITGLRRAGKTTLMFQIVDYLLREKEVNPLDILYFSFDEGVESLDDIVRFYENEIKKCRLSECGRVYLLLDEVQKSKDWENKVKILYDFNPSLKIIISGSLALALRKNLRESLAGRFFEIRLHPLSFDEYIDFTGVEIDRERESLFEVEIKRELDTYFKTGGFVEVLRMRDDELRKKYFRESLLDRIVYRDIPQNFSIEYPEVLYSILKIVSGFPGLYLDYKNIAGDIGVDRRTATQYFLYLELTFLIQKLYNYSTNMLSMEKKLKRVYLSSTAFTLALSPSVDKNVIIEQFYINEFRGNFFWRSPGKDEIDLILKIEDEIIPVEIKMKTSIKEKDIASLLKFMKRYSVERGLLITRDMSGEKKVENFHVQFIPYWKYWTVRNILS